MYGTSFFVNGFGHLTVGEPEERTRNEDLAKVRGDKAIVEFAGESSVYTCSRLGVCHNLCSLFSVLLFLGGFFCVFFFFLP